MTSAQDIISRLKLQRHPKEGGWFAESYRADETLAALPDRYGAPRAVSTAIYYLLTPDSISALHRVASDEVFHFYLGDPVEMLQLDPSGASRVLTLGSDIMAGQRVQTMVPRGTWQGSRLHAGGRFALLGATVAPGFDYADYEHGDGKVLAAAFPAHRDLIAALALTA